MKKEELGCLILGASGFQAAVDNEENDVISKTLHDIWREAIKQRKSETKEEERGREERKLAEYKIKGDKHNNRMPIMNTCI